jgi:hypothetical protein
MTKAPKTNADGFALALAFYIDKNGRKFGAKTLMARELGVSVHVVDSWDGVGIPRRRLAIVSEKTGIPVEHLRPDPTK